MGRVVENQLVPTGIFIVYQGNGLAFHTYPFLGLCGFAIFLN
jgi:hypothetical protein